MKAAATRAAVVGEATVSAVAVGSGVSEQPYGEAETIRGARNRARRAFEAGDFDLGVGIEGGVAELCSAARRTASDDVAEAEGAEGLFLIMWAAATDGDRVELGAGPRLRLPDAIADRVRDGEELGPVMDDVLGAENVAEGRGAAGALTGNAIDRTEGLRHAVAGALGPFVTDLY